MKWLNRLIGSLLNACGLDTESKLGGSLQFFIYDTIKIMILLGFLIFVITYIQSYFPPERTKKILGRFHGIGANCIAALLGTITPFCSCSSIPLFMIIQQARKATASRPLKCSPFVRQCGIIETYQMKANERGAYQVVRTFLCTEIMLVIFCSKRAAVSLPAS